MRPSDASAVLICAIVGPDRFLNGEAPATFLRDVADPADDVGPSRFDGARAAPAEVLDEVRTLSLLGTRRIVIVEDADPFITANRSAPERYCTDPAPNGCLILLCRSLPRNTKLHRIIAEKGRVLVCEAPKGRAVVSWITERARTAHGKPMAPGAAQRLRDHVGDALGLLDAELSKLATYIGSRDQIAASDVDVLTGHVREETVFAITDAMASGDAKTALAQWEQVLATDRAAPGRALGGLAWGLRRLLAARRDFESGVGAGELARRLYTDPDVLERRLKRVKIEDLEAQQRDLLEADLAVKTGAATLESAVERFIVKHSTSAGKCA